MYSILDSTKIQLGIEPEYTHFDPIIITHINSVTMFLQQFGVGPLSGFIVTGKDEKWSDLLEGRTDIEAVKLYIYLRVRLSFDPPTNSFLVDAIERQIKELEWRFIVQVEKQEGGIYGQ